MLSLDPTMGSSGYPLLLQTGETANGQTRLIDRQHPHDLFMELAASYALKQHAGEYAQLFHQQMNRNDGTSIELPPDLAARLAAAGATDQQVREFAAQVYPNVDAATALRKLDRDIKRSRGVDVPEPTESPFFDRPC